MNFRIVLGVAAVAVVCSTVVHAHFKLIEPAGWIVESERGDPQKAAPCGGDAQDKGTPTNTIAKVVGGSKIHLKVLETIYHPGHYRVALAVNSRAELPPDPVTTERMTDRGPQSVWAVIQSPAQVPVIADGLFQHYTKPDSAAPYETDIPMPNISCAKCTLQVIEFMAQHGYNQPGGYSYHHCADVQITPDSAKPIDKGWPAATSPAPGG
jgi:hypothetical protein